MISSSPPSSSSPAEEETPLLRCCLCDYSESSTVEGLEAHVSVEHLDWIPYRCSICRLHAPTVSLLIDHFQQLHRTMEIRFEYKANEKRKAELNNLLIKSIKSGIVVEKVVITERDSSQISSPTESDQSAKRTLQNGKTFAGSDQKTSDFSAEIDPVLLEQAQKRAETNWKEPADWMAKFSWWILRHFYRSGQLEDVNATLGNLSKDCVNGNFEMYAPVDEILANFHWPIPEILTLTFDEFEKFTGKLLDAEEKFDLAKQLLRKMHHYMRGAIKQRRSSGKNSLDSTFFEESRDKMEQNESKNVESCERDEIPIAMLNMSFQFIRQDDMNSEILEEMQKLMSEGDINFDSPAELFARLPKIVAEALKETWKSFEQKLKNLDSESQLKLAKSVVWRLFYKLKHCETLKIMRQNNRVDLAKSDDFAKKRPKIGKSQKRNKESPSVSECRKSLEDSLLCLVDKNAPNFSPKTLKTTRKRAEEMTKFVYSEIKNSIAEGDTGKVDEIKKSLSRCRLSLFKDWDSLPLFPQEVQNACRFFQQHTLDQFATEKECHKALSDALYGTGKRLSRQLSIIKRKHPILHQLMPKLGHHQFITKHQDVEVDHNPVNMDFATRYMQP